MNCGSKVLPPPAMGELEALLRLYLGAIRALCRLYQGYIQTLLRLYQVLPPPAMGELEALMAKAEAFKQREQQLKASPLKTSIDASGALKGDKSPARLVGGDAGKRLYVHQYQ
jgi:hypothetical protein